MKAKSEGDIAAQIHQLLERSKTSPSATLRLAELLTRQGRAAEAITRLRPLESDYRESYRFHVVLARAYRAMGNTAMAKTLLAKACQLAPQNEVALRELIRLNAPTLLHSTEASATQQAAKPSPTWAQSSVAALAQQAKAVSAESQRKTEQAAENLLHAPSTEAKLPQDAPLPFAAESPAEKADMVRLQGEEKPKAESLRAPQPEAKAPEAEEKLLTESDIFDEKGMLLEEFGMREAESVKEMPEISFSPEPKPVPKYDSILDLSQIPAQKEEPPAVEPDEPKISLDRAKLSQVLSRLSLKEEREVSTPPAQPAQSDTQASTTSAEKRPDENGKSDINHGAYAQVSDAGGVSATYVPAHGAANETARESAAQTAEATSKEKEIDDIESLAAQLANFKAPPVQETNDPTPISEQRKPFDDDEEIKVPTRQLAEIFVAQGAYAKAIKVYEALAEKEPHNAFLFNIIINGLRAQIK
jgi:tetratricopeptide (TPR) repeat protein